MSSEGYICAMAHSRFHSEGCSSSGFMQNFLRLEPPISHVFGFLPLSSMFLCNHLPRLSPERCIKLQIPFISRFCFCFSHLHFWHRNIIYCNHLLIWPSPLSLHIKPCRWYVLCVWVFYCIPSTLDRVWHILGAQ